VRINRREFLAAGAASLAGAAPPLRLGIDLFSIRSQGWSPFQMLDYCARSKVQVAFFSEISFLGGLEPEHLKKVRAHAEGLGIAIEIGMRSICPSAKMFDAKQETAEEQLGRMIAAAKVVGSPLVRAVLVDHQQRITSLCQQESAVKLPDGAQPHCRRRRADSGRGRGERCHAVMVRQRSHSGQQHRLRWLCARASNRRCGGVAWLPDGKILYHAHTA
jgi:hypothetical protein